MENSREMDKEVLAPLLTKSDDESNNGVGVVVSSSESTFLQELKRVSSMAAPMVAVTVSQYLLQVVSLIMVGHLGILVSFSGVAIASSYAEVTGLGNLKGSWDFFLSIAIDSLFSLCSLYSGI